MRRLIDSTLRNVRSRISCQCVKDSPRLQELDNKGYICPNCKATFQPLEVDRLMDFQRGAFLCDQCPTSPGGPHEIVLNEDEESVRGSKDRMERFNWQTKFVREGLRRTEAMTLPAFDVAIWVKNNVHDAEKQKQAQNGGLKIAGADGKNEDAGVMVMMSADKDEATRRREREAEADAKRQQNAMPSWHLKSTITNDLTALGIAAASQQANGKLTGNEAILSSLGKATSNGDVLTGLGRVKPQPKMEEVQSNPPEEDVKPIIDHNADCKYISHSLHNHIIILSRGQSTNNTTRLSKLQLRHSPHPKHQRRASFQATSKKKSVNRALHSWTC